MNGTISSPKVESISPAFEFIQKINTKLDHLRGILKTVSQNIPEKVAEISPGQPTQLLGELYQIDAKIAQILDCVVI